MSRTAADVSDCLLWGLTVWLASLPQLLEGDMHWLAQKYNIERKIKKNLTLKANIQPKSDQKSGFGHLNDLFRQIGPLWAPCLACRFLDSSASQ